MLVPKMRAHEDCLQHARLLWVATVFQGQPVCGSGTDHVKLHTLKEMSIWEGLKIGLALDFRAYFFVL